MVQVLTNRVRNGRSIGMDCVHAGRAAGYRPAARIENRKQQEAKTTMSPRNILFGLLGALACSTMTTVIAAGKEPQPAAAAEDTGETAQPPAAPEAKQTKKHAGTTIPVTGAFGLTLGSAFDPAEVNKVMSEETHSYRAADKTESRGTLYSIEPLQPDPNFARYALKTTSEGVIYEIRADVEDAEKRNLCKQTKQIADKLIETYGKPRGKGMLGDWYAFRDMSVPGYRGIRFNAPKCQYGRYSISYRDENLLQAEPKTDD